MHLKREKGRRSELECLLKAVLQEYLLSSEHCGAADPAAVAEAVQTADAAKYLHEDNAWGIEVMTDSDSVEGPVLVPSSGDIGATRQSPQHTVLPEGVVHEHPSGSSVTQKDLQGQAVGSTEAQVEDLTQQLANLFGNP